MQQFTESVVEEAALAWLESLGYAVLHGPDIAEGMPGAERSDPSYRDVVLEGRLRQALARLNPDLPAEAIEDAYRKLTRADAPSLLERKRAVHRMLVDGITVEYRRPDGSIAGAQARVLDFAVQDNNDRLAVKQFAVADGQHTRRPDVVLFVNGLPLAVIELKNPAGENATIWSAYQQLQTYQAQIPALFATNAALIVSDGVQARIGAHAVAHEEALAIRDEVGFFQAVRAVLANSMPGDRKTDEELERAIRQIIAKAMVCEEVVDIFAAAGLRKPDISILSDEFLAEVQGMPQRNLAVELLRKLLKGEIKLRSKRNVVQARSFAELLEQAVRKTQNRAIETAQMIEELIRLAQDMRAASARGEALHLSEDELAFYDALEVNDSAVKVPGEPTLVKIARELVDIVKKNVTIDWTVRENLRAQLRVIVKRILRKYGYPPDKQEQATQTVLEQAEGLSQEWAIA